MILLVIYSALLYGLYVPDWQFHVSASTSLLPPTDGGKVYTVGSAPLTPRLAIFCVLLCFGFDMLHNIEKFMVKENCFYLLVSDICV